MAMRALFLEATPLLATVALLSGGGCSSSVDPAGGGGTGGQGGNPACKLDFPPTGTFTFHIHNAGSSPRSIPFGCGSTIPIQLDTPTGPVASSLQGIAVADCNESCEDAYTAPGVTTFPFCSDCGGGMSADLPAGSTVDITWNRIGRVTDAVPAPCVGDAGITSCLRAIAVAASMTQTGTLTVCSSGGSLEGDCGGPSGQTAVSFTVDTTKGEATIEVM
jgi:hypothetical protein